MQAQQQSPSHQRRPHVAVSADSDGAGACCRICLDPLCPHDTDIVKLGCRCSTSGFDAMHRACAAQWFGPRKSTTCEVCSAEAVGLPLEIKAQIRLSQLAHAPQQRPLAGLRAFSSVPVFLASYLVFCLLPAAIVSLSLAFFFINVLAAEIVTGMSLSVALATSTILHWICFPQRPLLHACFVAVTLGCSMACALLAATAFPSWGNEMQSIAGGLSGFLLGALVFYCFVLPIGMLLARCLHSQSALYLCACCSWRPLPRPQGADGIDIERAAAFSSSRTGSARAPEPEAPAAADAQPQREAPSTASRGPPRPVCGQRQAEAPQDTPLQQDPAARGSGSGITQPQ